MEGCLKSIVAAAVLALLSAPARADRLNNEWTSTTRNLSMGNVGIASSEDPASAMFYNPAGFSRAKHASFEVFNPQFDIGTGAFGMAEGLKLADNLSLDKIQPGLRKAPNKASSLGFSLYPNFYTRNFNFGLLVSAQGSSYFDGTNVVYRSRYLVMPTLAVTAAILNGRFRLGLAARGISITENDRKSTATSGIGYRTDAAEGIGLGVDAGALLALPWAGLPTLGIVARNVGNTRFGKNAPVGFATGNAGRRATIPMTVDAGFAIFPKFSGRSALSLAADYRDVLNSSGADFLRHLNLGGELALSKSFYLRAGVSRGYWTAGIGLSSKYGSLDIGSYADELDATEFRGHQDRRVSFRYGSKF
jgi:hypothetical protein